MMALQAQLSDDFAKSIMELCSSSPEDLDSALKLGPELGAFPHDEDGGRFLFWIPELEDDHNPATRVLLRIYRFADKAFDVSSESASFSYTDFTMSHRGQFAFAVISGLQFGNREQWGDLYEYRVMYSDGSSKTFPDPLAASMPFGAGAPSELYDTGAVLAARKDYEYFRRSVKTEVESDGLPRVQSPASMLEIHSGTASADGTFAGLNEIYRGIAKKTEARQELETWEQAYIEYDAVQLMPIEPTILYEGGPHYWEPVNLAESGAIEEARDKTGSVSVRLRRPDGINWGYDSMIAGSPAPQPSYLRSGRPHELLDLIETLHSFPGKPIMVVLDVVYGHLDNQSMDLMNRKFFAGPNMYGQDFRYQDPMVRTFIMEMLRRKALYGVDGIRIDGAQDFKVYDESQGKLLHDDDFLALINSLELEVGDLRYRPWMIFEDGRPWPREDWELASSYREITRRLPNVVQWGPLTFAHNTPFLFTFWATKWWRIEEVARYGSHWITGTANHDTLRRGTQVDTGARINSYLGADLPERFANGYDNYANRMFDVMMPGIPMDFLQANLRVPWSFIRNTDWKWGPKVMSEEANFIDWCLRPGDWNRDWVFAGMKSSGFSSYDGLRRFLRSLGSCLSIAEFDTSAAAKLMEKIEPPLEGPDTLDIGILAGLARTWMQDVAEICRVTRWYDQASGTRQDFAMKLRHFRNQRPWLIDNIDKDEMIVRHAGAEGAVVLSILRKNTSKDELYLMCANMEGAPQKLSAMDSGFSPELREELKRRTWKLIISSPDTQADDSPEVPVLLENSRGVIWRGV